MPPSLCKLFLIFLTLSKTIPPSLSIHSSFCNAITTVGGVVNGGGIGTHHFPTQRKDFHPPQTCNPKDADCFTDEEIPTVRVYSVKNGNQLLNGWLRVNIQSDEPIYGFFISGELDETFEHENQNSSTNATNLDDFHQAKGEFVAEFPTSTTCPQSDATKYQVLPCGGIGRSELTVPTGVFYIDPFVGDWKADGIGPPNEILQSNATARTEFNLYYRFSDYYCTVRRFYFRLFALAKILSPNNPSQAYYELRHGRSPHIIPKKIIGAYDPLPMAENSNLDCSAELASNADWVDEAPIERLAISNKGTCIGNDENEDTGLVISKYRFGSVFSDIGKENRPKIKSARCSLGNTIQTVEPSPKAQLHYCEMTPESKFQSITKGWESYETYVKDMYEKHKGKCDCSNVIWPKEPEPNFLMKDAELRRSTVSPLEPELIKILPELRTSSSDPNKDMKKYPPLHHKGVRVGLRTGKALWRARVGHGVMMVIVSTFITPVSIFITRYYKETFMDIRIVYARVWNIIHVQSVPSTWVFIIAGETCTMLERLILGKSLLTIAAFHRNIGYFLILLYAFLTFTGGIRCYADVSRRICIFCHWFLGVIFYLGLLVTIVTAVGIPGSPLADEDTSVDNEHAVINVAVFIIFGWFLIDFIFHGVMTLHLFKVDRELSLASRRFYFPVPIPVVREDEIIDSPKSNFRKFMLCIYIATSLTITIYLCVKMIEMSYEDRGFGPMSCTHHNISTVREHFKENCHFTKTKELLAHLTPGIDHPIH